MAKEIPLNIAIVERTRVAVTVIILIVSMAIHMFCNIKGIQLDIMVTNPVSSVCTMLLYYVLTKNEKSANQKRN